MDAIYFFVIAAVIASFGITIVVRTSLEKLVESPNDIGKLQTRMLIYVALIEVIPLILIVTGFIFLQESTVGYTLPLFIVLLSVIVNFITLFMKRNELLSVAKELQSIINTLFLIGTVLMTAIPLIAIVAMFVR